MPPRAARRRSRRVELQRAASSSPSARQASPTSTRTRAASYGASSVVPALLGVAAASPGRRRASPSASATAPAACAAIAREHPALVGRRDLAELAAGAPRLLEVADGEHDLDVGRQQPGPLQRRGRLADHAADRRPRPRPPSPARAAAGRGPAAAPSRSGSPRGTPARPPRTRPAGDGLPPGGRGPGLRPRFIVSANRRPARRASSRASSPGPVQLHDLGPVHEATAREGHGIGLLLAPAGQGRRPLAGAAQLVDLLAGRDHAAVDEAGGDRRQLAGRDRDHGLVEQPETFPDLPVADQHVALAVQGEGDEIRGRRSDVADLRGCGCSRCRLGVLTGGLVPEHDRQQQVALLGAVAPVLLEQPLRPAEPAGRPARLSSNRPGHAHPARAAGGAQRLARACVQRGARARDSSGTRRRDRACRRTSPGARDPPLRAAPARRRARASRRRRATAAPRRPGGRARLRPRSPRPVQPRSLPCPGRGTWRNSRWSRFDFETPRRERLGMRLLAVAVGAALALVGPRRGGRRAGRVRGGSARNAQGRRRRAPGRARRRDERSLAGREAELLRAAQAPASRSRSTWSPRPVRRPA